jgi:hypothetical protein
MFEDILRNCIGFLSSWYPTKKVSSKKDLKIRKEIIDRLKDYKIEKKNLKETHINFNNKISKLLKSQNLKNFLRQNFVQKMCFVQNRLFIFSELKELKKSKKWKFYNKLLTEGDIGNPIRYFLYLKSSGNIINHVYHLSVLENELNINLANEVRNVYEFGSGYGCMARIFSKINKKIKYVCFDTQFVNLLQYYFLKHNNLNVGFNKNKQIYLSSSLNNINYKNDLFIANWSLSETPINFRKKILSNILKSKYILICFQEKFENINNLKYFDNLKFELSKKFKIIIKKNKFYKGNIFSRQNHYFFIGKKL